MTHMTHMTHMTPHVHHDQGDQYPFVTNECDERKKTFFHLKIILLCCFCGVQDSRGDQHVIMTFSRFGENPIIRMKKYRAKYSKTSPDTPV